MIKILGISAFYHDSEASIIVDENFYLKKKNKISHLKNNIKKILNYTNIL